MFLHCPMNSCTVFNGRTLYRCGKASYLAQHGMEPGAGDVIDLEEIHSREEMKAKIRTFFSAGYLPACRYCSLHPQAIAAAEQLEGDEAR